MSAISQVENVAANNAYQTTQAQKKSKVSGKTIGNPALSEKAQKYYEQLKKKYSNMDFILVSKDQKEQAKAQAGNYANANRMVVLIDDEKIERMAEDESYRKQYEGIIASAGAKLPQLKESLGALSANVKTFGMQVNGNGTLSYFAVIDKSLASQKARIEKKAEEKREAKKAADKKAAKKEYEKNIEKKKTDQATDPEDTITITASSMEELIQKINSAVYGGMGKEVLAEAEKQVGQHFDYHM